MKNKTKIDDLGENFKKLFIDLIISNYRLGSSEYKRNGSYNCEHFHYKAEKGILDYLCENEKELYHEILKIAQEINYSLKRK